MDCRWSGRRASASPATTCAVVLLLATAALSHVCFAGSIKGVDSTAASHEALDAAKQLATTYNCIVAVTGANDLVGTQSWYPSLEQEAELGVSAGKMRFWQQLLRGAMPSCTCCCLCGVTAGGFMQ